MYKRTLSETQTAYMKKINAILITLVFLMLNACANYKLQLSKDVENWSANALPTQNISHKIFLVGDAGGAEYDKDLPVIKLLKKKLAASSDPENVTVVYLGDNIYDNGMPSDKDQSKADERKLDEFKLEAQLDAVKDFKGRVHMIAGNHDWYGYGLDGLKEQEDFVEDLLDRKNVLGPKPGCGDPKEIDLTKDLVLILLDSQWFLENWEGEPGVNEGCDVKSRSVFALSFEETLKGNRNKNVVVAMHHPIYTFGPHGGSYRFKDHVFPLTAISDDLWIPLPLIGSIYPFLRSAVGSVQDVAHPKYREFKNIILNAARKNGSFIFASGHEHSLQFINRSDQAFIVSGSGSKKTATKLGEGGEFSYGAPGFSELIVYEDGSVWVQFWTTDDQNVDGRVVFRKKIKDALTKSGSAGGQDVTAINNLDPNKDSYTLPISERDYSKKGLGKAVWGAHYRESYAEEVTVPQLDLEKFKGGVSPVKRGGGYQTNSLRLETKEERQYTMRSVKKDPTRTVPYPLNQTFVLDIVSDNFSAAHPLAANVIPPMADAVGVYHSNPQLFYVPKQPALNIYNDEYGDALYLVEERPSDDLWKDADFFGNPDDIVGTPDVLEAITEDQDHRIDYQFVVRNRLFDNLVGDWDRHDDQWRWSEFKDGKKSLYRPIPRDRDQAFSRYDGWLVSTLRPFSPALQPLRPYDKTIKKEQWSNYGARYFDPTFLSGADWEAWRTEAEQMKAKLTDEIIDKAFADNWPENFYALDGKYVVERLKSRRDNLMDIAERLYKLYAKNVEIIGTEQRELFEIERKANNQTVVKMYDTNKEGDRQELLYERTFNAGETKEIRIYALGNDDIFRITGTSGRGPLVRLIGGEGEDEFYDQSKVGGGKKTIVYDITSEDRKIEGNGETKQILTDSPFLNSYNRKEKHYEFNYGFVFPSISFNPDDGLLLGGLASFTNYSFKKEPYSTNHNFGVQFSGATNGFQFTYQGNYIDVMGPWDLQIDGLIRTPLYTSNFYGLGNETVNLEDEIDVDYHRLRQSNYSLFVALMKRQYSSYFAFGPEFESTEVDLTSDRFIATVAEDLNPAIFDGVNYLGLKMVFDYQNIDNAAYPNRGLGLVVNGGWKMELSDNSRNFPYISAALSIYQKIDKDGVLVFATRIGGEQIFNDKYEFFQAAKLGGLGPESNIRGFRRDRFMGQSSFYHNTDLRLQVLASRNRAIPFVLGVFGGFDYGRVWQDGDGSDLWHTSIGGGVFISPFNVSTISIGVFRGDDAKSRITIGGGFFF